MVTKLLLGTSVFLATLSVHANTNSLYCLMNPNLTKSQFFGSVFLDINEDNSVNGIVRYATKDTKTSKTVSHAKLKVTGTMRIIAPGEISKNQITSFRLKAKNKPVNLIINSTPNGIISSYLLINSKDRYSSTCYPNE